MTGWLEFGVALAVFQLSHMIPVRPPVRPWLVQHLGLRGYFLGYSVLSVGLLIWLIVAAGRAPYVEIIPPLEVLRWGPLIVMPLVCVLAVQGMAVSNPLSFGGLGKTSFDPARPGILGVSRHPLLLAMMLWGLVHILANGDLAHVILFGLIVGFAGLGMVVIDRRKQRQMGVDQWQALAQNTARLSVRGLRSMGLGLWTGLATVGIYVMLVLLHAPVIGVSPMP